MLYTLVWLATVYFFSETRQEPLFLLQRGVPAPLCAAPDVAGTPLCSEKRGCGVINLKTWFLQRDTLELLEVSDADAEHGRAQFPQYPLNLFPHCFG